MFVLSHVEPTWFSLRWNAFEKSARRTRDHLPTGHALVYFTDWEVGWRSHGAHGDEPKKVSSGLRSLCERRNSHRFLEILNKWNTMEHESKIIHLTIFRDLFSMEHESKNFYNRIPFWENQTREQRPVVFWLRKSPPQLSFFSWVDSL